MRSISAKYSFVPQRRLFRVRSAIFAGAVFAAPLEPSVVAPLVWGREGVPTNVPKLSNAAISQTVAAAASAQPSVPEWARVRWEALAKARSLQWSTHAKPNELSGDFDGDGKVDLALLVEHRTTHKIGIVFVHHDSTTPRVVGAGIEFGNGGDNFDWMDSWKVQPRTKTRPTDAVVIERESSASALISFARGKYHWKQLGD